MSQPIQNVPVVSQPQSLIPFKDEWDRLQQICTVAVRSGLIPLKSPEQAIVIALKGRELSIPPMYAFTHIQVIQGKPSISPELMKALVFRMYPNATFHMTHSDEKSCTIEAARPSDKEKTSFTYTFDEASKMGLATKDNWKKQPAIMLQWRCVSKVCRFMFPECLMGMSYTPEELGAEVNEEGEVVETPTKQESVETLSTAAPSNEWAEPSDIKTPEVAPDFSHKSVSHAYISERQSKMVYAKMKSLGWDNQAILDFLKQWRVSRTDKIAQFQFDEVLKQLDEFQKRVK